MLDAHFACVQCFTVSCGGSLILNVSPCPFRDSKHGAGGAGRDGDVIEGDTHVQIIVEVITRQQEVKEEGPTAVDRVRRVGQDNARSQRDGGGPRRRISGKLHAATAIHVFDIFFVRGLSRDLGSPV